MTKHATQGHAIVKHLMRRPLTYAGMLALGAGLSPWRRAKEGIKHFPGWKIVTATRKRDGLVTWHVIKAG